MFNVAENNIYIYTVFVIVPSENVYPIKRVAIFAGMIFKPNSSNRNREKIKAQIVGLLSGMIIFFYKTSVL